MTTQKYIYSILLTFLAMSLLFGQTNQNVAHIDTKENRIIIDEGTAFQITGTGEMQMDEYNRAIIFPANAIFMINEQPLKDAEKFAVSMEDKIEVASDGIAMRIMPIKNFKSANYNSITRIRHTPESGERSKINIDQNDKIIVMIRNNEVLYFISDGESH